MDSQGHEKGKQEEIDISIRTEVLPGEIDRDLGPQQGACWERNSSMTTHLKVPSGASYSTMVI